MKILLSNVIVSSIMIAGCYMGLTKSNSNEGYSALNIENVEALSSVEGPTAIGCRMCKGATCYIFDGYGNFIDKRKDQYPG